MRGCLLASPALLLLASCATTPANRQRAAGAAAPVAAARPRCDATTGSHIPRCGVGDDNREVIYREELEALGVPLGSSPPLLDKLGPR